MGRYQFSWLDHSTIGRMSFERKNDPHAAMWKVDAECIDESYILISGSAMLANEDFHGHCKIDFISHIWYSTKQIMLNHQDNIGKQSYCDPKGSIPGLLPYAATEGRKSEKQCASCIRKVFFFSNSIISKASLRNWFLYANKDFYHLIWTNAIDVAFVQKCTLQV